MEYKGKGKQRRNGRLIRLGSGGGGGDVGGMCQMCQ